MKWIIYISVILVLLAGCANETKHSASERVTTSSAKKITRADDSYSELKNADKSTKKADSYVNENSGMVKKENAPAQPIVEEEIAIQDFEAIEYEADESVEIVTELAEDLAYEEKGKTVNNSFSYKNSSTQMKAYGEKATQVFNDFIDYLAIISDKDLSKELRERAVTMSINSFADDAQIYLSNKESKSINQFLKQIKKGKSGNPTFNKIENTNSILTRTNNKGEFVCITKNKEVYKVEFELRKTSKQFGKKTMQVDKVYLTNIEKIED